MLIWLGNELCLRVITWVWLILSLEWILNQVLIMIWRRNPNNWSFELQIFEIEITPVLIKVIVSDQLFLLLFVLLSKWLESWILQNDFFLHSLNGISINSHWFMIWLIRWLITILIELLAKLFIIESDYFFMQKSWKFSLLSHLFLMIVRLTLTCMSFRNMASKSGAYIKSFATKGTSELILSCLVLSNHLLWSHFTIWFRLYFRLSVKN